MKNIAMSNFKSVVASSPVRSAVSMLAASMALLIMCALPARAIEIQEVVSPKGIHAWLVEDGSVPLVSMRFSFKGAHRRTRPARRGWPI